MFPSYEAYFCFSTLHLIDIVICLTAGVCSIIWFEGLKMFNGGKQRHLSLKDS